MLWDRWKSVAPAGNWISIPWSPAHCLYFSMVLRPNVGQGLLILEVSRSHTTTHYSRKDSSGRMISSSQRPLPDNTQHPSISPPNVGFAPTIPASERPQTYALDCAATGTGKMVHESSIKVPIGTQHLTSWAKGTAIAPTKTCVRVMFIGPCVISIVE